MTVIEYKKLLGGNLLGIRKIRKLSVSQVAKRAGISSVERYRKMEMGVTGPRLVTLVRLAKALNVEVSELFSQIPKK